MTDDERTVQYVFGELRPDERAARSPHSVVEPTARASVKVTRPHRNPTPLHPVYSPLPVKSLPTPHRRHAIEGEEKLAHDKEKLAHDPVELAH